MFDIKTVYMIIISSAPQSVATAEAVSSGEVRGPVGGSYRKFSYISLSDKGTF